MHTNVVRLSALTLTGLVAGAALVAPAQAVSSSPWGPSSAHKQAAPSATATGKVKGHVTAEDVKSTNDGPFVVAIWPAGAAPVTFADEPPRYKGLGKHGSYTFSGLEPGKYIVGATDFTVVHEYSFYKHAGLSSHAKVVTVKKDQTISDVDITLHKSAKIKGVVQDVAANAVTANVQPFDADGVRAGFGGSFGSSTFRIAGIPGGSYRLKLTADGFPDQWYGGTDENGTKKISVGHRKTVSGLVATLKHNVASASLDRPELSGTVKRGKTLTATTGTWDPTPASYSYRWLRDGKPISGATDGTYKLTSKDVGHKISVRVGAVSPDTVIGTRNSAKTAKVTK